MLLGFAESRCIRITCHSPRIPNQMASLHKKWKVVIPDNQYSFSISSFQGLSIVYIALFFSLMCYCCTLFLPSPTSLNNTLNVKYLKTNNLNQCYQGKESISWKFWATLTLSPFPSFCKLLFLQYNWQTKSYTFSMYTPWL